MSSNITQFLLDSTFFVIGKIKMLNIVQFSDHNLEIWNLNWISDGMRRLLINKSINLMFLLFFYSLTYRCLLDKIRYFICANYININCWLLRGNSRIFIWYFYLNCIHYCLVWFNQQRLSTFGAPRIPTRLLSASPTQLSGWRCNKTDEHRMPTS